MRRSLIFRIVIPAFATVAFLTAISAHAQFGGPASQPATQVHDPSALKPPAGARVAIYEFEDMECPVCGNINPLLREAAAKYNLPWLRHDFPLPYHAWSMQAAINARWFDTQSKKLGDDYRDAVFANQPSITTLDVLRKFTEKFAADRKISLPFAVDPQGTLAAAVKADFALGQRIGIQHTPTIWIVTSQSKGAPFIEVLDRNRLYQIIDQALADTKTGK
jgi:protein-disulfide isomerase